MSRILVLLALAVVLAVLAPAVGDLLGRLASRHAERRRRSVDSGEVCHDPECLRELTYAELWESVEHLANTAEMGALGGTYMTAYWCEEHAPADAVRWRA